MQRILARVLFVVGLFAAGLGLAGTALAQGGNTLRWSGQGDALTFDPHSQNETPTIASLMQVYESLVRRRPDLSIEGSLATSWETINPTTWQFKIRQGVTFHDGTPLTVEDIKFSIERAQQEDADYKTYVEIIEQVEIVDGETINLHTKGPYPLMLENLLHIFVMSKTWATTHDVLKVQNFSAGEENYAVRHANGTGPFKLELREPDIRTIMVKNDAWWGLEDYPHNVDRIVMTPISNNATRVAALLSGELDLVIDPPIQDLRRIERTPGLKLKNVPQIRSIFFGMEQSKDELETSDIKGRNPFKDKRVREAMYRAINAEAIYRAIMRGQSKPAGTIIPPGVNGYTEELDTRIPFDVNKAKALLTEAGYPNGFSIRLDCPNDRYNNDEGICQAVVSMLAKIGIRVTLDALPKSLHFPKIENRTTEFYLLGWGVPTLDSEYVFSFLYRSDGTWNAGHYANERVDTLIEQIRTEIDREKRNAMIAEVWQIVQDDIAYLPLHHQIINWAMSDRFDVPIMPDDMPRVYWGKFN